MRLSASAGRTKWHRRYGGTACAALERSIVANVESSAIEDTALIAVAGGEILEDGRFS